jgi:hypothetical protein
VTESCGVFVFVRRFTELERKRRYTVKIKRNGAEQVLKGRINLPYEESNP